MTSTAAKLLHSFIPAASSGVFRALLINSAEYTLSCSVNDGGTIAANETGSRDDDSVVKTIHVQVLRKIWTAPPALTASMVIPGVQGQYYIVENGSDVQFSVPASDSDTWTLGSTTGTDPDTLTYSWTGGTGGTFETPSAPSTKWTPPALATGETSKDFTVSCRVDDSKVIPSTEGGTRNDSSVTMSRLVRVVRKVWAVDTPIAGGELTSPTATNLVVEEGATIGATVAVATDSDKWTKGGASGNTTGTDPDSITYTWSAAFGTLSQSDGLSTVWTAPNLGNGVEDATYTFKCRINDTPKEIAANESGSRDDDYIDRVVTVKVIQKVWDVGTPISGGGTFTVNGSTSGNVIEVDPGTQLHIEVSPATDSDHWVKNGEEGTEPDTLTYTWESSAGGGATGQSIDYTAGQLPAGIDSVQVTLTCIVNDTPLPMGEKDSGTRNDASKSASITIKTVRKVWAPGQGIQGGVLTSPSTVTLSPGEHTGVAVSTATDTDIWAKGSQTGTDADTITYRWSGGGTFDNPNAAATNWTPPTLPTGVTTRDYTLTCTINDTPKAIAAGEGGNRNDAAKTATVTVTVDAANGEYGSALLKIFKQGEANTTDPNKPETPYVTADDPAKGQIYVALDIDSSGVNESTVTVRLKEDDNTLAEDESHIDIPVNLASATGWQKFYDPDLNTEEDPGPDINGPKEEDWWEAPEAPQNHKGHYRYLIPWNTAGGPWEAERFVVDAGQGHMVPGKLWNHNGDHIVSLSSVNNQAGDTLHFGATASSTVTPVGVTIENPSPVAEFSGQILPNGTLRACAGGIDDHDKTDPNPATHNDFQYRPHTRLVELTLKREGHLLANTKVTLEFEGNKGHDYGNNAARKTARFHNLTDAFDDSHWTETLELTTNAQGKAAFWVLSSDVICQPKIKVKWKLRPTDTIQTIGELNCDFDEATGARRFFTQGEPDEDTGWYFEVPELFSTGQWTPAKFYLKFLVDPSLGDVDGNWQVVNSHLLQFELNQVLLKDDQLITDENDIGNYAVLTNAIPTQSGVASGLIFSKVTSSDGAAQLWVKGRDNIGLAKGVILEIEDKSVAGE